MYKKYDKEDYIEVLEKISGKIQNGIKDRMIELEKTREAINDRYPFEDLFLKWAEVDYEKEILSDMLIQLETITLKFHSKINDELK